MDYFQIQQDPRINYTPTLLDLGTHFDKRWVINEEYDKIPKITAFHIKEQEFTQYPDLLDRQIPIISKSFKELITLYEPQIMFKTISLIEAKKGMNKIYYLPIFKTIKCLHESTQYNLDETVIKTIVLDKEKIEDLSIFKVGNEKTKALMIRLDLMESLLRRNIKGIGFNKIRVR